MPPPSREQQIAALIADAERQTRAHATNPVGFARSVGIEPDPWQARVLTSRARRLLLNCCRQSGKSTTTAILALHRALYTSGALVLIVSPSLRQSRELLRKIVKLLPRLPVQPTVDAENSQTIEFANGSRIVSLPANEETIRGYSANLLIIDESGDVDDKLYRAVRPMLIVSKGQLVALGTPKGRRGWFFDAFERQDKSRSEDEDERKLDPWERVRITAKDCPRIPEEDLAEERRSLGDAYAQEYECAFVNLASGLVYNGFDETRNVIEALPPVNRHAPWSHLLGLDFGVKDDTAFTVLAYRDHDPIVYIPTSFKRPGLSPSDVAGEVRELEKVYSFERIVGDVGGLGKAFQIEARQRFSLPIVAAQKTDKLGFIALMNGALRAGQIQVVRSTCQPLIDEWTQLSWVETQEGQRKENPAQANHCVDSALYIWRSSTAYHNRPIEPPPADPVVRQRQELDEFWRKNSLIEERKRDQEWWEEPNQLPLTLDDD